VASIPKAPRILIVAGSDSGGGAGIQADIKTVTMLGGHAMTAITAITAQNTLGVQAVHMVPTDIVLAQIESCVSDIGVDAVKIGMIGSAATAHSVADRLAGLDIPIVFDPVMIATSGSVLADEDTIAAFERLMRIASVVTPNLPELEALSAALTSSSDHPSTVRAEPVEAPFFCSPVERMTGAATGSARTGVELARQFDTTILVKGGHTETADVTDILYAPAGETARWSAPRIDTSNTHGTGCTLASAIATGLGQGMDLPDAVARAIRFVRRALEAAPGFGKGHGPMGQQSVTDIR
jgi:hydroxymethylpyrimidine/phosphomethylpyrimidine kinase